MNKLFYPAIFHKAEEGGFWVSFPDLPECLTEGDNMEQAYEMAVDALGLSLASRVDENQVIPEPSQADKIAVEDGFLVVIEFDMQAYRKRTNSRSVKKTLSIPQWLNEEAIEKGINFSHALQEILIMKIQDK
ncbi:MAG TPA: HicB family protein [Lachnospiraceae bacterium]|nr:type II toxin-antitoxin system HicB family antitoxin [uncultured Lachnoclostridium sp.]HAU84021.1 HicB family protein [Lachnospiraceae bacterium]